MVGTRVWQKMSRPSNRARAMDGREVPVAMDRPSVSSGRQERSSAFCGIRKEPSALVPQKRTFLRSLPSTTTLSHSLDLIPIDLFNYDKIQLFITFASERGGNKSLGFGSGSMRCIFTASVECQSTGVFDDHGTLWYQGWNLLRNLDRFDRGGGICHLRGVRI